MPFFTILIILSLFVPCMTSAFELSPELRLSTTQSSSWHPSVAVVGQTIHVAWMDYYASPNSDIYYIRSDDAGINWNPVQPLITDADDTRSPCLVARNSNVFIAYACHKADAVDWSIILIRSQDGGRTWSDKHYVYTSASMNRMPVLAMDPAGVLHLAWTSNTSEGERIGYCFSSDLGETWSAPEFIGSQWTDFEMPLIVFYQGQPEIVFRSNRKGYLIGGLAPFDIFLIRKTSQGWSWPPLALSETLPTRHSNTYFHAAQSDSAGRIHVCFKQNDGGSNVFHRVSSDGGFTWSAIHRLSEFPGSHPMPEFWDNGISIAEMGPGVVYHAFNSFWNVGQEANHRRGNIYLSASYDGGYSWGKPAEIVTSGRARDPQIFRLSDEVMGVVWCDDRDDVRPDQINYGDEIYFRTVRFSMSNEHFPRINSAGWWETELSANDGGTLEIAAFVDDPDGLDDIVRVELAWMGEPVGVFLEPGGGDMGFDPDSGMFGGRWNLEPGDVPADIYNLEIEVEDAEGNIARWPYLEIYDVGNAPLSLQPHLPAVPMYDDPHTPVAAAGGYASTFLTEDGGGMLTIEVKFLNLGSKYNMPQSVELYYDGMPTGIFLNDDGPSGGAGDPVAGDGTFTWKASIPPGALQGFAGTYYFTVVITDAYDNKSEWPFLIVRSDL